ncbi:MAG: hypothetical protein Q4C34_07775 [Bacteroidales bacterium]|nr:hypothetical protein [Bacteroidales bacterium]
MDNALIKPYKDALDAQKAQLEGYLTRGFQAIAIPADNEEIKKDKKDFLTSSGSWFIVLGIIALIAGLVIANSGVIIAGCAAIMSGVYCYIKGRQAIRHNAFVSLGQSVYTQISSVADNIAAEWSKFMTTQNDMLKKEVVASTDTADVKVSLIDKIDSTPDVKVDLDEVQAQLADISDKESLSGYSAYLPQAADVIRKAINAADGAQQGIYSTLAK